MKTDFFQELTNIFSKLPGIGEKSAERLIYSIMEMAPEAKSELSKQIEGLNDIRKCVICNYYTLGEVCHICEDDARDQNVICVVDDPKSVILLEKNQFFNNRYFVLNKTINLSKGIDVEQINLNQLDAMINKYQPTELLLVMKPSIEGETTALYISRIYKDKLKITKFAQGIPLGADIEYLDPLTIEQAMKDRKEY